MLEAAAIYIVMAIGKKLLDHAGDDVGDAFDTSLRKLARWAQEKVASRPTGKAAIGIIARASAGEAGEVDRDNGREVLTAALEEVTANDPAAARELESMVTELERLAPPTLTIEGGAFVEEVTDGTVIGAESSGKLQGDTKLIGEVKAGKVVRGRIVGASHHG